MLEYTYLQALKEMKNVFDVRLKMAKLALEHGVSSTARQFSTTRDTVRKWRDRYSEMGPSGLIDQSRAPKSCPHKLPRALEEKIIEIRKKQPYLGPYRIKSEHNIPASQGAINRVLKTAGLIRPRKRKHRVKKNLRKLKEQYRAFQKMQVDIKELRDIPRYYPFMLNGFPPYQFSVRDVRTGIAFVSYGFEKSATNAAIFLDYVCQHLRGIGVDLSQVEFQTDNGSEFVGAWNSNKESPFEKVARGYKAQTSRIPPGQSTYNSDVEAFHKLIQDELYDVESYENKKDFLIRAFTYILYFNYVRKFRYKAGKSPWQLLKENSKITAKNKNAGLVMPIILDNKIKNFYFKGDDYVPRSDR